jgi:hypothetical protein|tara:strand:+ start:5464 stop:5859 length:396 start_codon:yes stop_codon:yes gene_type:complete
MTKGNPFKYFRPIPEFIWLPVMLFVWFTLWLRKFEGWFCHSKRAWGAQRRRVAFYYDEPHLILPIQDRPWEYSSEAVQNGPKSNLKPTSRPLGFLSESDTIEIVKRRWPIEKSLGQLQINDVFIIKDTNGT